MPSTRTEHLVFARWSWYAGRFRTIASRVVAHRVHSNRRRLVNMRQIVLAFAVAAAALLTGCADSHPDNSRSDSAARQAGRAAYQLKQDAAKGAHNLERGLNRAARDVHQGWTEAKHSDPKHR